MWRHGDVMIQSVKDIPSGAKRRPGAILMHGEITGHTHRIKESGACELYEIDGTLYMKILTDQATVVHEEHLPISLKQGFYKVWQQREYTPKEIRRVKD